MLWRISSTMWQMPKIPRTSNNSRSAAVSVLSLLAQDSIKGFGTVRPFAFYDKEKQKVTLFLGFKF